tara:strand:- start:545 stop:670 length:126 start_codon:yes stop_codon:yes gene_type:complete
MQKEDFKKASFKDKKLINKNGIDKLSLKQLNQVLKILDKVK